MDDLVEGLTKAPEHAGATRVRNWVLASACALALVTYAHRLGFAVGAPELKKDLRLDDAQMGYLLAAFFWSYGGFQVLGGWLGDRFGSRNLLTLLVLGWSLTLGALALVVYLPGKAEQLAFLLVLRFLFGAFQAGGFPLLSRIIADWLPVTMRGTSQGLIWMSSRLGGALIPLVLAPMFRRYGTWRTPFWILSGVGVAWCAAFWPWFRNRPEESSLTNKAERSLILEGRSSRAPGRRGIPWGGLIASRSAWALCLAYGFLGSSSNFFIGWLPTYLREHRGFDLDTTKWLTSLPLAFGALACVSGGAISDGIIRRTGSLRWGRRLNGAVGMIVAAVAFAATTRVQDPSMLAFLLCLTFACSDLAMAPAWAACADIGERCAGTLGGAMNMMANVGGAVAALIAGYLFQHHRPELVFLISSGSYLLAGLCWLGVDATRPVSDAGCRDEGPCRGGNAWLADPDGPAGRGP